MSEENSVQTMVEAAKPEPMNPMEFVLVQGLNTIISRIDPVSRQLKAQILNTYPELVLPRLHLLTMEIQSGVVEAVLSENPNTLVTEESWWSYIQKTLGNFKNQDTIYLANNSAFYVLLNRVRDLREEVSWHDILSQLSQAMVMTGIQCGGFTTVLDWLVESDPQNLKNLLYKTETKSYPSELKSKLYKQLVKLGLLDVKIARRIRSDSSGSLSAEVLACLFENRNLYKEEEFQDLVTQFADTKHKWVARYIAMNMPMNLVPFLMGIKDSMALKILERRMEVSEV
jgi:hypothetical protein